jgi:hypothetical protein
MEYVKSILQRAWKINADDMEYMEVGSPELEEAFIKQHEIEEVIEALKRGKENSREFDVTEPLEKILDKHEKTFTDLNHVVPDDFSFFYRDDVYQVIVDFANLLGVVLNSER